MGIAMFASLLLDALAYVSAIPKCKVKPRAMVINKVVYRCIANMASVPISNLLIFAHCIYMPVN